MKIRYEMRLIMIGILFISFAALGVGREARGADMLGEIGYLFLVYILIGFNLVAGGLKSRSDLNKRNICIITLYWPVILCYSAGQYIRNKVK